MMLEKSLKICLFLISSSLLAGQPSENPEIRPTEEPLVENIDDESSIARQDKTTSVALKGGYVFKNITGAGLSGQYYLSSDFHIEIQSVSGKTDLRSSISSEDNISVTKAIATINLVSVMARYYLSNSFFISVGLGQRKILTDLRLDSIEIDQYLEMQTNSISSVGLITIGNIWSWDSGFFIGFDLFGASIPISSGYESKTTTNLTTSDSAFSNLSQTTENLAKMMGTAVGPISLMINIGTAF